MSLQIKENFPLSSLCTFGIGGPARYLALPRTQAELTEALEFAKSKNLKPFIYGGGSNLLFPDEGLNTVVIKISTKQISHSLAPNTDTPDSVILTCDAGVTWIELARYCTQNHLYGAEGLYGLPGTFGGAVYGNAGCHGQETKDILLEAKILDTDTGMLTTYTPADLKFDYRTSILKKSKNLIVLSVQIKLSTNPSKAHGNPNDYAQERKLKQPTGLTTGSFFKNPPNDHAGRLIEAAGLKGFQLGDIMTSDKHANFFINTGKATAAEVLALKNHIQSVVFQKFGIQLEPEVQIVESQV
jgi:UDP-N-acetylmuramate dehydrogenase